ncbi:MAG: host attachment protein [Deltaproteobacteria bacterium]|nr:host attachment protein [Deltaproteobacteria bacterium]
MSNTWVVVADGGQAKLFRARGGKLTDLEVVQTVENTHAYGEHRGAMHNDGNHHALEDKFSAEIAKLLLKVANENGYTDLVIVADPKFLGALRNQLDPVVAKRVSASINHDWVRMPLAELGERIAKHVAEGHQPKG